MTESKGLRGGTRRALYLFVSLRSGREGLWEITESIKGIIMSGCDSLFKDKVLQFTSVDKDTVIINMADVSLLKFFYKKINTNPLNNDEHYDNPCN